MVKLVLASSSPRRRDLLNLLTNHFTTGTSEVEAQGSEEVPSFPIDPLPLPHDYQIPAGAHPTLWAWRKGVDVARGLSEVTEPTLVLAADTIVIGRGILLGKPGSAEEAARMLRELRGRKHYVATGFILLYLDGR